MYKVKICYAIMILAWERMEQEWTCKTSNWLRLHAAPFLKIRMEAAVVRILTNLLFLIFKGQNLDE